jgi:hypothetical protein
MWYLIQFAIVVAVAISDVAFNWAGHNNLILGIVAYLIALGVTKVIVELMSPAPCPGSDAQ